MFANGKQFLLLISYPPCYSYIYIVKSDKCLVGDIEEKKSIPIRDMDIS